jgi:hypothetical protein
MTFTRAAMVLTSFVLLAACTTADQDKPKPDPGLNLSTIRAAAWTVTAQDISGAKDATMSTIGGFQSFDSVATGGLVVSAVDSKKTLTLAGIDAKSGSIAWRRVLPLKEDYGSSCADDDRGPLIACSVIDSKGKTQELTIIDDRTGKVRKQLEIGVDQTFDIEGDQLYLTSFVPADKDKRLDVTIERRSWSTGTMSWREKTAFAIEGWGHDGGQGFIIGSTRVAAYSASWEVVVDRNTGHLLSRADAGRYEQSLRGGGWLVIDSGDGTGEDVTTTLFTPSGDPVAEDHHTAYNWAALDDDRFVSTGRRVREQSTGRSVFEAPQGQQVAELADAGRVVLTEPVGGEHGNDHTLSYQVWDTKTGDRRGIADAPGDWMSDILGGGRGVLLVADRYDEKANEALPSTLHVIDTRKPGLAASIDLGWKTDGIGSPTLISTRAGAAVTGPTGVKGLVVRP